MSPLRPMFLPALLLSLLTLAVPLARAEDEPPAARSGTFAGTVVEKGNNWFRVRNDAGNTMRFMPRWIGGLPKDGGGLDKAILKQIRALEVETVVSVDWVYDERPRAVKITVTAAPPASGAAEGTITEMGETWVRIKPAEGPTERYNARWIGGAPKDGGGPDKDMVATLKHFKAGDKVRIQWIREEGKRLKSIEKLP